MNKKNIFMLSMLLLTTNQIKPGLTDDYFHKLWLFFLIEMGGTFAHEFGHASVVILNEGIYQIYLGVTSAAQHSRKSTDGKVNLVTMDPTCGYTRVVRLGRSKSRVKQCELAAFGPLYGMLYFFTMYRIFGVLEHRFSPTLYSSLRTYALVQVLKEFLYAAVPLSASGDTQFLYTKSKLMSEKAYKAAAAKNFTVLKAYAQLCLAINCLTKLMNKISSTESMEVLKKEHAQLCLIYKITSSYALQYGLLGTAADALLGGMKEVHHKRNKIPENAPSIMDYVGGVLVAPLII